MGRYDNFYREGLIQKVIRKLQEKGLFFLLKGGFYIYLFPIILKFFPEKKLDFKGKTYTYFHHRHNFTYANERAIEIPLTMEKIPNHKRILEVGNVLSYYYDANWDILDKYEVADKIFKEDVITFNPQEKYDFIVSISTLEHVGYDETPRDYHKVPLAINNLRDNCLSDGGEMFITVPLGYNPEMDKQIFAGELGFDEGYFFKRLNWLNVWQEVSAEQVKSVEVDYPYLGAEGLFIGTIRK